MRLSASDHDLGGNIMGEEFRKRMMDLASRGKCESSLLLGGEKAKLTDFFLFPSPDVQPDELRSMEDVHRKGAMSDGLLSEQISHSVVFLVRRQTNFSLQAPALGLRRSDSSSLLSRTSFSPLTNTTRTLVSLHTLLHQRHLYFPRAQYFDPLLRPCSQDRSRRVPSGSSQVLRLLSFVLFPPSVSCSELLANTLRPDIPYNQAIPPS